MSKLNYLDRPPRIQPPLPHGEYPIPNPPDLQENANQALIQTALPMLSIIGYVAVSVLGQGRNMLMIIPMALTVVASTAVAIYSYLHEKRLREEAQAAYSQRLIELRRDMENYHEMQRTHYHYNYPDAHTALEIAADLERSPEDRAEDVRSGTRLWERRSSDVDFGCIRLGMGTVPSTVLYKMPESENYANPQLRDAVRLAEDSQYVHAVPVTVPLKQQADSLVVRHSIGISGSQAEAVYAYVRTLLVDYTTFHSPNDTRVFVIGSHGSRQQWRWAYALPHCKENDRSETLAFEAEANDPQTGEKLRLFLKGLRNTLERRKIRLADKDSTFNVTIPFLLVVVDLLEAAPEWSPLADIQTEAAITTILEDGKRLGAAVLFLVPKREDIPSACGAVLEVDPDPADPASSVYRYAEVDVNSRRFVGRNALVPTQESARDFARRLETINVRSAFGADLAATVTLLELTNTNSIDQLRALAEERWKTSLSPDLADWLRCSVGLMAGNEPRTLVFSAKADGVHGLVAGSTGSGKSELLTTMILSLALNYDPRVLNFVLVDYKGGSAFEPFRRLPHCVDIVTNLEGSATARMFAAIVAELDRRQRLNTYSDSKDIVHYRNKGLNLREDTPPYPHLFIIIDEFAEMIAGNAEFKAQLESITRLGRALGVTLILAAQKPAGVTDQMRANIKFRICLRVETPEDSRELLRRSDAAFLPPGIPGRGYLQIGNENVELIQTGYSGGDYLGPQSSEHAKVIWLDRKKKRKGGEDVPKLHNAVVEMLAELGAQNSKPQWRPWPAFLPRSFSLDTPIDTGYMGEPELDILRRGKPVEGPTPAAGSAPYLPLNPVVARWFSEECGWEEVQWEKFAMRPVVGLIDNPYSAHQHPLVVNFPTGHAVLYGASGWGKTSFLRTLMVSLMTTHSPDDLHIYILDFGGRNLNLFKEFPHVGAVINSDEEERVQRLMRKLGSILEERQMILSNADARDLYSYNQAHPESRLPAVLFIVDNFSEFKENYESQLPALISLLRDGRAFGIHILLTAEQPSTISGKLFNLLTERMTLKLSDATEYSAIVGRGATEMGAIAGRGLIRIGRTPLEFQTALPVAIKDEDLLHGKDESDKLRELALRMNAAWEGKRQGPPPASIETLATRITLDQAWALLTPEAAGKRALPVIGMDDRDLQPYRLDLDRQGPHMLLIGPPNSGKTTILRTITLSLCQTYTSDEIKLVLIDFQRRFIHHGGACSLADLPQVVQAVSKVEDLADLLPNLQVECQALQEKGVKRQVFVLIDNYDSFSEETSAANRGFIPGIGLLAREFGTAGFHVIACGSPGVTSISDDLKKQVTTSSFGIALQSLDAVGRLNGKAPRSLAEVELPAGRSFVIKSGRTFMIQVATPYVSDDDIEGSLDALVGRIQAKADGKRAAWLRQPTPPQDGKPAGPSTEQLDRLAAALRDMGLPQETIQEMQPADIVEMAKSMGIEIGEQPA